MIKPIYKPSGRAGEYGDYALNIYTGCPHRCYYCFAPQVLRKDREEFHSNVTLRNDIIKATQRQLVDEEITGQLIHICFTCDPYPKGHDTTATREIIKALKMFGNHVQILTKNGKAAMRDFDLLDNEDWFGITYAGYDEHILNIPPKEELCAGDVPHRLAALVDAHNHGIKTWVSYEPVLNAESVLSFIKHTDVVDKFKIGKLNYWPSDINWAEFGQQAEEICKERGLDYYIKEDLRKLMSK